MVDEAYVEFADAPSASGLIDRYENLGVLRTLSKAWALAGARIGSLLASAEVIALLRRIMPPYPLPTPCVDGGAGRAVRRGHGADAAGASALVVARARAHAQATGAPCPACARCCPRSANFLCVRFDDAPRVYRELLAAGVVVRDVRPLSATWAMPAHHASARARRTRACSKSLIRREVSA